MCLIQCPQYIFHVSAEINYKFIDDVGGFLGVMEAPKSKPTVDQIKHP
jgi:hypothetical protein